MHFQVKISNTLILAYLLISINTLTAIENEGGTPKPSAAPTQEKEAQPSPSAAMPNLEKNLTMSSIATKAWLDMVDKGRYGESWDAGSKLMRGTVKRNEWEKILTKTRKPLGEVKSRSILDQRTAKDPKNMPKGDYMVLFYNTSFSNKPLAYELITLFLESDGQWRVITYNVN